MNTPAPLTDRIDALIDGDFVTALTSDTVYGRPIDHDELRARFRRAASWRTFVRKTWVRWRKWAPDSGLPANDIIFLANSLRETLRAEP